ncbi:MAG: DUF3536 domain-containing protein [Candidatus Schekmanbacteria bacterium]|nr:DUF3536 domain-containing protein [Candidatus Schekmanbacteria bacterium]
MNRSGEKYVVVHGHFYQPPRENAWTGAIDVQPSAAPYPNWNERIWDECYRPNTASRVLDRHGKIEDLVNNFAHLSFNVGPTLIRWLERVHPGTLRRMVAGDRVAAAANAGHGSAIAHPYDHLILPLATRRDRLTAIRWGIRDFCRVFGREPEGFWLPETAVDFETLQDVAESGISFVILEPHQVAPVPPTRRARGGASGAMDIGRPYRWIGRNEARLDVLVYNGPVSRALAFDGVLTGADRLAAHLRDAAAATPTAAGGGGVVVATDGETFGHHKPFADMCLAYFFAREAARAGLKPVTAGAFIAAAPARHRVTLAHPPTSWSCAHGVERWRSDCSCGEAAADHGWRAPFRACLDELKAVLDDVFACECEPLVRDGDVWAARDELVDVLAEPSELAWTRYAQRVLRPQAVSGAGARRARALLMAQRYGLAMFTSCGWFFGSFDGVEPLQNLHYAARAINLLPEPARGEQEKHLRRALRRIPVGDDGGTGEELFDRKVAGRRVSPEAILHEEVTRRVFGLSSGEHPDLAVMLAARPAAAWRLSGRGHVASAQTGERSDYLFTATYDGGLQLSTRLWPIASGIDGDVGRDSADHPESAELPSPGDPLRMAFRDLRPEAQRQILGEAFTSLFPLLEAAKQAVGDTLNALGRELSEPADGMPGPLRAILSELFTLETRHWFAAHCAEGGSSEMIAKIETAASLGMRMERTAVLRMLEESVGDAVRLIWAGRWADATVPLENMIAVARRLGVSALPAVLQDAAFHCLHGPVKREQDRLLTPPDHPASAEFERRCRRVQDFRRLAESLNIAVAPWEPAALVGTEDQEIPSRPQPPEDDAQAVDASPVTPAAPDRAE